MSLREAFGRHLVTVGRKFPRVVVLDADLAGGTHTFRFRDEFPDRFIQCGVAEQNMMGIAAGLATTGFIPIVTTFAVFASLRALEQARDLIGYGNLGVKIITAHPGIDTGPDGATHQAIEDMAIFRSIPNYSVVSPFDAIEMEEALEAVIEWPGPVYMRTGRSSVPVLTSPGRRPFAIGRASVLRPGGDLTICATGIMVHRALDAAGQLSAEGIEARVVNVSTIKPIDAELVSKCAQETGAIVTAEDHNMYGGLGSAVAEVVVGRSPCPVEIVAIQDRFGGSGEPDELAMSYGLAACHIKEAAIRVLGRKRLTITGRSFSET
jgi:transketolase